MTYITTVLQGPKEVVAVTAWTPSDDYAKNQEALKKLVYQLKGVRQDKAGPEPGAPIAVSVPQFPEGASAPRSVGTVSANAEQNSQTQALSRANGPQTAGGESVPSRLRQLDRLFKDGVISSVEYETKKADLLKAL